MRLVSFIAMLAVIGVSAVANTNAPRPTYEKLAYPVFATKAAESVSAPVQPAAMPKWLERKPLPTQLPADNQTNRDSRSPVDEETKSHQTEGESPIGKTRRHGPTEVDKRSVLDAIDKSVEVIDKWVLQFDDMALNEDAARLRETKKKFLEHETKISTAKNPTQLRLALRAYSEDSPELVDEAARIGVKIDLPLRFEEFLSALALLLREMPPADSDGMGMESFYREGKLLSDMIQQKMGPKEKAEQAPAMIHKFTAKNGDAIRLILNGNEGTWPEGTPLLKAEEAMITLLSLDHAAFKETPTEQGKDSLRNRGAIGPANWLEAGLSLPFGLLSSGIPEAAAGTPDNSFRLYRPQTQTQKANQRILPRIDTKNVLVVIVDDWLLNEKEFQTQTNVKIADVKPLMEKVLQDVSQAYREISFNKFTWNFDICEITGPPALPRPGASPAHASAALFYSAITMADPQKSKCQIGDFASYDDIIVFPGDRGAWGGYDHLYDSPIAGPDAYKFSGISVSIYGWFGSSNDDITNFDLPTLTHELGHSLGLLHANSYECGHVATAQSVTGVYSKTTGDCIATEYGDLFDVMGDGEYATLEDSSLKDDDPSASPSPAAPVPPSPPSGAKSSVLANMQTTPATDLNCFYKEALNWLTPSPVTVGPGTYPIAPLEERPSGIPQCLVLEVDQKNVTPPISPSAPCDKLYIEYRVDRTLSNRNKGNLLLHCRNKPVHALPPLSKWPVSERTELLHCSPPDGFFVSPGGECKTNLGYHVSFSTANGPEVTIQTTCNDGDGDGYQKKDDPTGCFLETQNDCDDRDPKVHPGAPEVFNGKDNNCDGKIACKDKDGDKIQDPNDPPGCEITTPPDCDDTDSTVYPGAPEICDGKHNDCNNLSGSLDMFGNISMCHQCYDSDSKGKVYNFEPKTNENQGSEYQTSPLPGINPNVWGYEPTVAGNVHTEIGGPRGIWIDTKIDTCADQSGNPSNTVLTEYYCRHGGLEDVIDVSYVTCKPPFHRCVGGACVRVCNDKDGDGYQDPSDPSNPKCVLTTQADCNDNDASIHPGATRVCGMDKACETAIYQGPECFKSPPPDQCHYCIPQAKWGSLAVWPCTVDGVNCCNDVTNARCCGDVDCSNSPCGKTMGCTPSGGGGGGGSGGSGGGVSSCKIEFDIDGTPIARTGTLAVNARTGAPEFFMALPPCDVRLCINYCKSGYEPIPTNDPWGFECCEAGRQGGGQCFYPLCMDNFGPF